MAVVRWKSNVKFLWTGIGTIDVVSEGAANASFSEPGAALDGLLVGYEITNIATADANGLPTEREVGRNLWTNATGTLTRSDGAPADRTSAGIIGGSNGTNRVNFSAGTKLVSITPLGEGFGTGADHDIETQIVNVKHHGATGDGTTDDATAINAAIAAANALSGGNLTRSILWFPPSASRYRITTALTPVGRNVSVWMEQAIQFAGTPFDGIVLSIGSTTSDSDQLNHRIGITSTGDDTRYTTTGFTGVYLPNLQRCKIDLFRCSGFETGVEIVGDGGGSYGNQIFLGELGPNRVQISIGGRNTDGWFNSNRFYAGAIKGNTGVVQETIGIHFFNDVGAISGNDNIFYGPVMETNDYGVLNDGPANAVNVIGGRAEGLGAIARLTDASGDNNAGLFLITQIGNSGDIEAPNGAPFIFWSARKDLDFALAGQTLKNLDFKDYSETSPAQTGITGNLTLDFAAGPHHEITHGAGNIDLVGVNNWPASGKTGALTVDWVQDGTGGRTLAHSLTGFVWAGGSPTFDTAAGKTNRVTYVTRDGGTEIVAHYGGAW